jgi:hypothetical protein
LEKLLHVLLNITEEQKEQIKDLTEVPTIDHQHEKITTMLLCTITPHHQPVQKNQTRGRRGLHDNQTTFEFIEFKSVACHMKFEVAPKP